MQIQTLSVVVPVTGCVNHCKFCVSRLHASPYPNQIEGNERFRDLYERDYRERMLFARDNGCNTVILTGEGEPLQNRDFMKAWANWNEMLGDRRFRWIELQTSGFNLHDSTLRFLRNTIRVSTISLSVADPWDQSNNAEIMGMPPKYVVDLPAVCAEVKRYDFNLRLSLNLTSSFDGRSPEQVLARVKELGADQLTLRVLYESGDEYQDINRWIRENRADLEAVTALQAHIAARGRPLERLPFGAVRYSLDGVSTVLDDNCMPQEMTASFRYLILRPNCKLYSRWDDPGSLVF